MAHTSDKPLAARARRWLCRPTGSAIVALAMLLLVMCLPRQSMVKQRVVGGALGRAAPMYTAPIQSVYLVREPSNNGVSTWRVIDENVSSWDELGKLISRTPERVVVARTTATPEDEGYFGTTRRTYSFALRPWSGSLTSTEVESATAVFAGWLKERGFDALAVRIRSGDTSRVLWSGYAVNLLGIVLAAALGLSLSWIRTVPQWRRNRRWRLGLCVRCAYDLAGGVPESDGLRKCPECGEFNGPK